MVINNWFLAVVCLKLFDHCLRLDNSPRTLFDEMHFSTLIVSVLATLVMATPMADGNVGDIEKRGVCGNGILKRCLMLVCPKLLCFIILAGVGSSNG